MTKSARQSLLSTLSMAIGIALHRSNWMTDIDKYMRGVITKRELASSCTEAMTISARLGKEEKPSKRFTPPLPAEYWNEKKAIRTSDRGYITNGVYHRSHVERFAGTYPA